MQQKLHFSFCKVKKKSTVLEKQQFFFPSYCDVSSFKCMILEKKKNKTKISHNFFLFFITLTYSS